MLIKVRKSWELRDAEITPHSVYKNRREVLKTMGLATAGAIGGSLIAGDAFAAKLSYKERAITLDESLTSRDAVTGYNNFYEFGTDKSDPARYAGAMKTSPWSVKVEGECAKPGTYALEDILKPHALEERIYRHRCVEAWSMVIPWVGFHLGDLLQRFEPTGKARYVQFETLADRAQMRGLRFPVLDWPYVEGLRMDEAMHPLAIMAVGVYGEDLPNQNGAPLRLVVPWKYGFKGIKSIVAIRFMDKEPATSWNISAPREYGFYSNVNPKVDHPRWSQASERRIGEFRRRPSLMFNGYGEEVAHLYAGMDLKKLY